MALEASSCISALNSCGASYMRVRSFPFGEDVARKGGVYGVTRGLLAKTSSARVFDTLLDETSILGLALAG